jgi:putative NADH-flavin reductase
MRLAIFGATGRTGKHLVEQALAQGHTVTAFVRDATRLGALRTRVNVVQGNVGEAAKVAQAVAGAEAVLSVLAPSGNQPVFAVSQAVTNILAAMNAHGVQRLIMSTGAGVRDPQDRPTLVHGFFGVLVKLLSRNVYEDMFQAVEKVRASDVDWTIVRVPMLTDGPLTGQIRRGYVNKDLGVRLARADLADYLLKQLMDRSQIRQAPAISN